MSDCDFYTCDDCKLENICKSPQMPSIGSESADIMFILECPDYLSDLSDTPFTGNTRLKLDYYLNKLGKNFDDCYFTYAIKCRPKKKQSLKKITIEACRGFLQEEIISVKPKVIIAMGRYSWQILTGHTSIKEFRGHFEKFDVKYDANIFRPSYCDDDLEPDIKEFSIQLMPTYSIDSAYESWFQDFYIMNDMKKSFDYVKTGKIKLEEKPKFLLVDNLKKLKKAYKILMAADTLVVDLETTGLYFFNNDIIQIGYSDDAKRAIILPFAEINKDHMIKYTDEEISYAKKLNAFYRENKKAITKVVKKVNANTARKIAHNAKFELKFCKYHKIPLKNMYFDTIIADALVNENKLHNLNAAMETRGINYGAYDTKLWEYVGKVKKKPYSCVPPKKLARYLAIDVVGDFKLYNMQVKELNSNKKLKKLFFKKQMPLCFEMCRAEYYGFKMDVPLLKQYSKILHKSIEELRAKFIKMTKDEDFNPSSPDMVKYVMERARFPFKEFNVRKGAKGYSVDKKTLMLFERRCTKKSHKKFISMMQRWRAITKLKSTFVDGKDGNGGYLAKLDGNGFIHPSFNIATPRTGRLSSSEPNCQQLPRPAGDFNVRNTFVPHKSEWVVWEVDKSQLELRLGASLFQDNLMLKEFRDGVDMHSRNIVFFNDSLELFDKMSESEFLKVRNYKPPFGWHDFKDKNEVKKIKEKLEFQAYLEEFRTVAKTIGFSIQYGSEAKSIAEKFDMPIEVVQDMLDLYLEKYHELSTGMEREKQIVLNSGVSELYTGRLRRVNTFTNWITSSYGENCYRYDYYLAKVQRPVVNFKIQGTANEIYTSEKLNLFKDIRKYKLRARLQLSVHDGMINSAHIDDIPKIQELCGKHFNSKFGEGRYYVPLPSDFEVYTRWKGEKIDMEHYDKWRDKIKCGYKDYIAKELLKK